MEVAPTRTMMVAEFMNRYSWTPWVVLSASILLEIL